MEEAPENSKESQSAHSNGMNEWIVHKGTNLAKNCSKYFI